MAIDIKEMFVQALLKRVENQSLSSITIQSLLDDTGASRQTFYNHFQDKNDLICYIYNNKIIPSYSDPTVIDFDFSRSLLESFYNMKNYHIFLEQALRMEDMGCLKDYILNHCSQFDLEWHQACYGEKKMPEELVFATKYHAIASSSMTISWVLSGMPVSCEEITDMIVRMRGVGMDKLFSTGNGFNPYKK